MKWFSTRFSLPILVFFLLLPGFGRATADTYYHVTVKAMSEPSDPSDCEWAWVTLLEIPKSRAYPREAALAQRYGGTLRGSVLALVRADAWRSAHRRTREVRCNDRPSDMVVSWQESRGDMVYAMGGLNDPDDRNKISFGFTNRDILDENGRWFDPRSRTYVVAGIPVTAGSEPVEMKGDYMLRPVNYIDPLKQYSRCGKRWVEQFTSALDHFHLFERFNPGSDEIFGQTLSAPASDRIYVYQIIRSASREHPHWQRKEI
ncbi:MAG: hypothetical protein HGA72_07695 [Chlorobiaceae bacterium]|nr:hypothetical protein [Chlorobiaceae bacterium]NTW63286.1 hypothetical protein [Chlorobiaceae bacterium]